MLAFLSGLIQGEATGSGLTCDVNDDTMIPQMDKDNLDDKAFANYLDNLYMERMGDGEVFSKGDATVGDVNANISALLSYLPQSKSNVSANQDHTMSHVSDMTKNTSLVRANQDHSVISRVDGLNNAYVKIVHTNGIHHLAMVSCVCHGPDLLPMDLIAC